MIHYPDKTMVAILNDLRGKGFKNSFDFEGDQLICIENKKAYNTEQIKILDQYRFEGMTNPADSSIVFAIKCNDGQKGTVVSAYGPYANPKLLQFMSELERKLPQTK